MARNSSTPNARPTAEGVDPATPTPEPQVENQSFTSDAPKTDAPKTETSGENLAALPGNGEGAEANFITVKTKEDIVLMDPFSAYHIDINGAKVPVTNFINAELEKDGRLEKA